MQVKVLGCGGGIGGHMRTTALLLDDDVLIDAGTGVCDLSFEALLKIDHIFVTHAHLDHIATIPLLLDTVSGLRERPVMVYALPETIDALKRHIFNWHIWPDFTQIPNAQAPLLQYQAVDVGEHVTIGDKTMTALPATHTVPAVGYQINSGAASLVFSGDTAGGADFWDAVNRIDVLKYLIIETAFGDEEIEMARLSKHLCPALLAEELTNLRSVPEIYITHLKPGEEMQVLHSLAQQSITSGCRALQNQQTFRF